MSEITDEFILRNFRSTETRINSGTVVGWITKVDENKSAVSPKTIHSLFDTDSHERAAVSIQITSGENLFRRPEGAGCTGSDEVVLNGDVIVGGNGLNQHAKFIEIVGLVVGLVTMLVTIV